MRISDWSSDVCSSDLGPPVEQSQFKRYIFLGGCFPGDVIVGITGDVNSAERKIRGGAIAEGCRTIGGIHVYIGQIEEAVAGFSNCRSEEHTSELQSLMRISYAVFCLKKKKQQSTD